nr:MAG TPA: Ash protein family protein [Caudoviricetes sp.]
MLSGDQALNAINQIRLIFIFISVYHYLCGKFTSHSSCAIVIEHWQNPVPGFAPRITKRRIPRQTWFFYAYSTVMPELWWDVQGHRKVRRVLLAGSANPVRLTTNEICTSGGD